MEEEAAHMFHLKHMPVSCWRLKLHQEFVCESTEGRKKQERQGSCCDPARGMLSDLQVKWLIQGVSGGMDLVGQRVYFFVF